MAKALITNRIYLDNPGPEQTKRIISALTFKIRKAGAMSNRRAKITVETIRMYKELPNGILSIPQLRTDLIPEGYEIVDKRVTNEIYFPDAVYDLFDNQVPVLDQIEDSCIINALVGFGKSIVALYAASKLGQKTLIVTHTVALRDQWVDEIYNMYKIKCGVIGGGKANYEDHMLVVANVQTLKKYATKVSKEFGTVIIDECLDYGTLIRTKEFGIQKLGKIVNQKMECSVLSYNSSLNKAVYSKVLNYHKNPQEEKGLKITNSGRGSLICTNNHSIFVEKENGIITKVRADSLKVGDILIQTKEAYSSINNLKKSWLPIVYGLVIGDGNINKTSGNNIRLRVTHGQDQYEYLRWKAEYLFDSSYETKGKSGYSSNNVYHVVSKTFEDEYQVYNNLYGNTTRKSLITKEVAACLNKQAWALIYQDDGSASQDKKTIVLSVCELDENSCNNLCDSLLDIFDISDTVVFTCKKGHRYIRINKEGTVKLQKELAPFVHPSMYYKLPWVDTTDIVFKFDKPEGSMFIEGYCKRRVTSIKESTLTSNKRYNIEVEDTHNYFANNILVSNCHRTPSSTFVEVLDKMYARYRIGLSGTLNRKDGKHILLPSFFGPKVIKAEGNTMTPSVLLVQTNIALNPELQWVERVSELIKNKQYQKFTTDMARVQMDKGHKVLIIADRVEFLVELGELLGSRCAVVTGSIGDRDKAKTDLISGNIECIVGARQLFSEGISINPLSCVILASPINNDSLLEQIVGRIQRTAPNKPNPVVLDFQFCGPTDRRQNTARLKFYLNKGWKVSSL